MPKQIRMPKLSDTMEEGRLLAWRKSVGDTVRRGDILAEVETDKADMEFESFTEGTLAKLLIEPGTTVPVGTLIAIMKLPGESDADVDAVLAGKQAQAAPAAAKPAEPSAAEAQPAAPAPAAVARPAAAPAPAAPAAAPLPPAVAGERVVPPLIDDDRIRATPRARRMAEERSVDLSEVEGSGALGAILVSDLEQYLQDLEAHAPDADGVFATPVAVRIASEQGLDLEAVKGSGPGGRITKSDVFTHLEREQSRAKERQTELFRGALQLSQKRKALIRNMVRSWAEAPHFYLQMDVRTDELRRVRNRVNDESEGSERPRLTYTHLIIKAAAMALEAFPEVNATYREDDQQIALFEPINIGLAVDVQDELVAPTIKACQGRSVFELAIDANELVRRARMRKLSPEDYADGTFTISNLGMFGVDRFYAIITPPQGATLSVASIQPRPVVEGKEIVISSLTTLGLSVDHRVLDGVKASQFLAEIKRLLEAPEALVADGSRFGS
jgi:pyruvate dehydrogenase E2 component (dihydrolipoamide acetyltransferase)